MHCKGEAQKSPLFWRFSGGFCFSQDRLFSRKSTRKPLNLIKSPIFTNAPCKTTCLYNAPSMHTVEIINSFQEKFHGKLWRPRGQLLPDFPGVRNAGPTKVWAFAGKGKGPGKIGPESRNAPGFSLRRPWLPSRAVSLLGLLEAPKGEKGFLAGFS